MRKALYIIAALGLTFASADATSRSTTKVQIVIRGTDEGPWKAYIFGATCNGKLELHPPTDAGEPVEITCK